MKMKQSNEEMGSGHSSANYKAACHKYYLCRSFLGLKVLILLLTIHLNVTAGKNADQTKNGYAGAKHHIKGNAHFQLPCNDINQMIIYGQSLSTGQQTAPAISVTNYAGNLMLGDQVWSNFSNNLDSPTLIFNPLIAKPILSSRKTNDEILADVSINSDNQVNCEPPIIGFTNAVKYYIDQYSMDFPERKFAATSSGEGGRSIELLSKNCPNNNGKLYNHYLKMIGKANEAAVRMKKSINCSAILWMQGEYNYTKSSNQGWESNTPATKDKQAYKNYFTNLISDMTGDVMNVYHQSKAPVFITYQCGAQYTREFDVSVGMAQLEAANSDPRVVLASPVYPVCDRGGHLCPNGSRWFGEMMAKVYFKTVIKGEKWKPLQPAKIIKGKNYIDIDFYVPEPPLRLDTLTLEKANNYGFQVRDAGQIQLINKVSLISAKKIRLALNNDLSSGNIEVLYAGPTTKGNGNVCDSDDFQSFAVYQDLIAPGNTEAEKTRFKPKYEPRDKDGGIIYNQHYPMQNFCCAFYYLIPQNQKSIKCI